MRKYLSKTNGYVILKHNCYLLYMCNTCGSVSVVPKKALIHRRRVCRPNVRMLSTPLAVTWRMAVQDPPLYINNYLDDSDPLDAGTYTCYRKCGTTRRLVWPVQTPRSDYFPWQYILALPPARFFAQIQANSFFNLLLFLDVSPQNIVSFL